MKKYIIGIQARTNSSRLPNKCFLDFYGSTLIELVFQSCSQSLLADEIFLLTSDNSSDDLLASRYSDLFSGNVIRGSLNNLPDRYQMLVNQTDAYGIVRVTGDNPLTDFRLIDDLIGHHKVDSSSPYITHNFYKIVEGFGSELFSFDSFQPIRSSSNNYYLDCPGFFYRDNQNWTELDPPLHYIDNFSSKVSATIDTFDDYENLLLLGLNFWKLSPSERIINFTDIIRNQFPCFKSLRKHYKNDL